MADPNLTNILAALAAQRQGGTPSHSSSTPIPPGYSQYAAPPPGALYGLPQPISSGSVDLSAIKPINSGSVNINDAITRARSIAAERGIDPRMSSRNARRSRSPSRSPSRLARDNFRDNYNPYRDERRAGRERRDRSFSPPRGGRYSPAYDGRSPTQSRGVDGDAEILPIEKSMVGLVIGRAGENLRRVESQTGARVQFMDGPETASPQRHCKISGNRSARAAARSEILRIIDDNEAAKRGQTSSRGGQNRSAAPAQAMPPMTSSKDGENIQILVPDRTVGLIIGRGGETIRDLQDRSACHVNIVSENKSINGMRPVNLIGSVQAQDRAKALISEIVESDNKGTSIKAVMGREDPYGSGPDKVNDSVLVPGDAVGMIIGKGGETIKEMQNQSGCKINVSPATGRDIEREIGLVGTRYAVDSAKRLIMEKVDAVEQRNHAQRDDRNDGYGDRYNAGQQGASYPSTEGPPSQQPQVPGGADPYAAYGGYQNYMAMWYAAVQAQQQGAQPPGGQ